jgi:hypothetical protein
MNFEGTVLNIIITRHRRQILYDYTYMRYIELTASEIQKIEGWLWSNSRKGRKVTV